MYERLYQKVTPNGVTLDKCIQVSLDNMGKINGLVAGDEECYEVSLIPTQFILKLDMKHCTRPVAERGYDSRTAQCKPSH